MMEEKEEIINNRHKEFASVVAEHLFSKGRTDDAVSDEICLEAQRQSIQLLITSDKEASMTFRSNINILLVQDDVDAVLQDIPYVILKGMSAAVYYPDPLRRTLGDIDVLVRPMDYKRAYDALAYGDFETDESIDDDDRHIHFRKDGVSVELHKRFAILDSAEQESQMDRLLYDSIRNAKNAMIEGHRFRMLPEVINGLVLLAHINQHVESGLGFRQIIDWIMFVNRSLHDDSWHGFVRYTDMFGLTTLAKTTTRLGQIYFGLEENDITWCNDVDEDVCAKYFKYIFEAGNFGKKKRGEISNSVQSVLRNSRNLKGLFSVLQKSGEEHWKLYAKHKGLKPFAWMFGAFRYIKLGTKRDHLLRESMRDIQLAKEKDSFLTSIGATIRTKK